MMACGGMGEKEEETEKIFESSIRRRIDPWSWCWHPPYQRTRSNLYTVRSLFDGHFVDDHELGAELDIQSKRAVLHIAPSVVSLTSYHGDTMVSACSGIIVESKLSDIIRGQYVSLLLASVSLFTARDGSFYDPSNLKLVVNSREGCEPWEGKLVGFDKYYRVALVEITSTSQLPTAVLGHLDVVSTEAGMPTLIAVGRHYQSPSPYEKLMVAFGKFTPRLVRFQRMEDGYPEEFSCVSCKISMIGMGGPLINHNGEVVGLNFYHRNYTPFLPAQIASKCLQHLRLPVSKHYLRLDRPKPFNWSGIKASSLAAARVSLLEKVIRWHPNWREGVLVEEVVLGSPADVAGIRPVDVIIKCAGKSVASSLEFLDIISDKAAEGVEVTVVRVDGNVDLTLLPQAQLKKKKRKGTGA